MAQVNAIVKTKGLITKLETPRKRDSNIEALVLLVIGVTAVLAIAIAIVILMVEFCGGLWLRPLSQDLFSARVTCSRILESFRMKDRYRTGSLYHLER